MSKHNLYFVSYINGFGRPTRYMKLEDTILRTAFPLEEAKKYATKAVKNGAVSAEVTQVPEETESGDIVARCYRTSAGGAQWETK